MGLFIDFHQLLDAAPDAMVVVDGRGCVAALNLEAAQWFGWSEDELLGEPMSRFIPAGFAGFPGSRVATDSNRFEILANGATVSCFARRRNGSEFPVELAHRPLGAGNESHSLVTLRDLTPWRRAQETRSWNNEMAGVVLESIGDAVITTDTLGQITYLNAVAEHLTGWAAHEAVGEFLDAVVPLISEVGRHPIIDRAMRCLQAERSIDLQDGVLLLRRDGTEIPVGDSAAPIRDRSGAMIGVVLVIQDESEKRRVGNRLSHDASHDALTGLINRREFDRRLARLVEGLKGAWADHALLCLDLDNFKTINDSLGHDAGDAVLRSLGPILGRRLRQRDAVARIGGDEFGVLLENCTLTSAERIANAMLADLAVHDFTWEGKAVPIRVSIGLAVVRSTDGGIAAVLHDGDAACYGAKKQGGNRVQVA